MKRIAIIPARGGSKRLPRKNILPVAGRPLLSYPIRAARESGLFERVIVSTEDDEIAGIASKAGGEVLQRPLELAGDRSTVVEVCLHVLASLKDHSISEFCCLYATALFITADDIKKSHVLLKDEPQADFVMGVSGYDLHPIQALREDNGFLQPMWPEYESLQSQFYPELVASNGTLYWARVEEFRLAKTFYGPRLKGFRVPRSRLIDINTPEELQEARRMAERIFAEKRD